MSEMTNRFLGEKMKISEVWQKGKIAEGYPVILAGIEHPITCVNWKKLNSDDPTEMRQGARRIKRLNPIDFGLLSERIRIRDFEIINQYQDGDNYIDWEIFQSNHETDPGLPGFKSACLAQVKLGLIRYQVKIAIYSNKKSRDIMTPIENNENLILDWQILGKQINIPDDWDDLTQSYNVA